MNNLNQKGFGLVEIIIAATVGIVILLVAATYLNFSLRIATEDLSQIEALYYAKSSLEKARSVRDEEDSENRNYGYENLYSLDFSEQYHFEPDTSEPLKWVPVVGSETIGRYTVQVILSDVYRDAVSNDIVSSGGILDSETLKITSNVSYPARGGVKQVEIYEYLANFK